MEVLYGAESLNRELKKLIFLAKEQITLVSPFLKIDEEMAQILKEKQKDELIVTSKDIDLEIENIATIISIVINRVL